MKIQTINQLISVWKDISTRHYQINGFGVGDSWEIGADKAYMHPVLWVNPVTANMPSTDTGYKTFEINFEVRVFDLVNKDESNENDVLSDCIDILKDIIIEFKGHPYYVNSELNIIDDISFEAFTEEFDEEVSGWLCEISLMTPMINSFCGIPAADISGFEFPDINCPDVNVLCPVFIEDIIGEGPIVVTGGTTKTISLDTSELTDTFVETSILNGSDLELTRNDGVVLTTDLSSLGGSITADNGLNILSGVVELGGTLNKDTIISGNDKGFTLGEPTSRLSNYIINGVVKTENYTFTGFGNITTQYTPNGITNTCSDSTTTLNNLNLSTPTQERYTISDVNLNQNSYLDIGSDQVQAYSEDTTTGQYSSFDISMNNSNFTHNSGGGISNGLYLSDDNIVLTMSDGVNDNAILIDETQINFNGVNPLACETISLQDKTLISDEFVHYTPTMAISDSCLINDSISFHMDGNDLAGRYKNNSGVVSDITFSGGGGSVTADNGLSISAGGDVELGGTLTKPTTILGNGMFLQIGSPVSKLSMIGFTNFYSITAGVASGLSDTTATITLNTGEAGLISGRDSKVRLGTVTGGNSLNVLLIDGDETTFIDGSTTPKGIQYDDDYSSTFVNRSLVDKEYVDTSISSTLTGFTGTFTNGDGDTVTVTNGLITNIA